MEHCWWLPCRRIHSLIHIYVVAFSGLHSVFLWRFPSVNIISIRIMPVWIRMLKELLNSLYHGIKMVLLMQYLVDWTGICQGICSDYFHESSQQFVSRFKRRPILWSRSILYLWHWNKAQFMNYLLHFCCTSIAAPIPKINSLEVCMPWEDSDIKIYFCCAKYSAYYLYYKITSISS